MYKVNNGSSISGKYPFIVIFLLDSEWWFWGSYSTVEEAEKARNEYHKIDGITVALDDIEVLW